MAAAWFLLGHGSGILRVLIAFPFPAYRSLKAILTQTKEDDVNCLRYWVVLALFSCLEIGLDIVLSLLPLYSLYLSLKLIFLLWLSVPVPHLNGTDVIFDKVITPLFHEHEPQLDQLVERANIHANRLVNASRELEGADVAESIAKKIF